MLFMVSIRRRNRNRSRNRKRNRNLSKVRFLNTGSLFCFVCSVMVLWVHLLGLTLFAFKCRTQTRTLKTTYKSNWKVKSSYIKVLKTMMQQPTKYEISNKWNIITIDLSRYPCIFIIAAFVRKMAGRYAFSPCGSSWSSTGHGLI